MPPAAVAERETTGELALRTQVRFEIKAVSEKDRTFEGLASTWEKDLGDDIIHQGAFKDTLAEWSKGQAELPMFYGHNYRDVGALVGSFPDYKETKTGLWVRGKVLDDPFGEAVMLRLKAKILNGMSIGYRAVKYEFEDSDEARWGILRHIKELKLDEISVVPFPMNPGARVDLGTVKANVRGLDRIALLDLKAAVEEALAAAPVDGRRSTPAPTPPQPEEEKQAAPAPPAGDDVPDFGLLARLQLRRLAYSTNARKEA